MKKIVMLSCLFFLFSCTHSVMYTAVGGKVASNASINASQAAAPNLFATEVNITELNELICNSLDTKFGNRWFYVGSQDGYDFISTVKLLESRDFYKLPNKLLYLTKRFSFTNNKELWETVVNYSSVNQEKNASHWQLSRCVGGKFLHQVYDHIDLNINDL